MPPETHALPDTWPTKPCTYCRNPVPCVPGKQPREFCEDCRRFRAYLAAALRHLERIDFQDLERAKVVRGDILEVANKVPFPKRRDQRGRFRS